MKYKILVNDKYEISLDDFVKWSGLSKGIINELAKQNVYQQMNNGDIVNFVKYEQRPNINNK